MKEIGETIFDIIYLISLLSISFYIISTYKSKTSRYTGYALLVLGFGDAFHLIPRIVSYHLNFNFVSILGIGKLITSITMSVFYIFMYYIYLYNYNERENKIITYLIWFLLILRIIFCILPGNNWLDGSSTLFYSVLRNIPFIIMGFIIILLYFNKRREDKSFRFIWLLILFSFIFYIPVIILSSSVKMIGMLMILKTICYIIVSIMFLLKNNKE